MNDRTCKTCKWWDRTGECGRVDNTEDFMPALTPTLFTISLYTPDDQGLRFKLVTGPDFGCALYEPHRYHTTTPTGDLNATH